MYVSSSFALPCALTLHHVFLCRDAFKGDNVKEHDALNNTLSHCCTVGASIIPNSNGPTLLIAPYIPQILLPANYTTENLKQYIRHKGSKRETRNAAINGSPLIVFWRIDNYLGLWAAAGSS